jgi:CheY-like chemotaxis protein
MTLHADPVRLAQVVMNLLCNAAKYMNAGGQIWLTARHEGEQAVICVRDMGMGIPADMIDHIFDMFAQVDHSVQRSQGGLGIGLTLAKSFVEMHGGRIEVHSEGLNKGSEFGVRLPLVSELKPEPPVPPVESSLEPLPAHDILVVDDSEAAAFTLGKLLEKMGQRVVTAFSALAALEILNAKRPDVIISDIGMPGIDGYELARRIRGDSRFNDVVLVALTGYGQDHDRMLAREAGFDQHLTKPVSISLLQHFLARLLLPATAGENTAK